MNLIFCQTGLALLKKTLTLTYTLCYRVWPHNIIYAPRCGWKALRFSTSHHQQFLKVAGN